MKWKGFLFTDIFTEIFIAKSSDTNALEEGSVPFIGRTSLNNGFQGRYNIEEEKIIKSNCITISMVGEPKAFYQNFDFACSQNILILRNDKILDENKGHFLCQIIDKYLMSKGYGYGYPVSLRRVKRNRLMLPVNEIEEPNWDFMESYIKQMKYEKIVKLINYYKKRLDNSIHDFINKEIYWNEVWLEDIVEIQSGKRLTKADMKDGPRPFIGSTEYNNGITAFVSNNNSSIDKNTLGVNYNGSVVESFYHPYEAVFSDDVKRISIKNKEAQNKYNYLYLKQAILQQKSKYQYGYKFNASRMKRQKIMLPLDNNGQPYWEYMANYMRKIEQEKIKEIIKFLENKYSFL